MRTIHVCKHCGSPRVSQDALAYMNTNEVLTYDDVHCHDCDGETSTTEVEVRDDFDLDTDFYSWEE